MSTEPYDTHRLRARAVARLTVPSAAPQALPAPGDPSAALAVIHELACSPATAPDALALLHELQVHQVELDLQEEELRRSRQELELALHRQVQLYEHAPVGYFTVDGDGVLREVNRRGAAMLGFDSELLRGRPFDGFLTADSGRTLREMLKRVSHGATADCAELELHGMQSEIRSVRAHACLDPAGGGFLIALSEGAGSGRDAIGE
jgi:PAS domain-containing protein